MLHEEVAFLEREVGEGPADEGQKLVVELFSQQRHLVDDVMSEQVEVGDGTQGPRLGEHVGQSLAWERLLTFF